MPRSAFTEAYAVLLRAVVAARLEAGLTQVQLSERLNKPQPFISKVERGVRRIDVIEFYAIARALGADPAAMFARVIKSLPKSVDI